MAEVRGMAFLGVIRHVRSTYGEERLAALLQDASSATRLACSERIRPNGWYPYAGFAGFLKAVEGGLGRGDRALVRELGGEAARLDLETTFGQLQTPEDPATLIRACTLVWSTYYRDAGEMTAVEWQPTRTVLRIDGFPDMAKEHCALMEGWMIEAMALIGARVDEGARETVCMHDGGPFHEFVCTWSKIEG